jgi:hypothetical protein
MSEGERALGHDSHLCDPGNASTWETAAGADVHVAHTHFPEEMRRRFPSEKVVFVAHGTPEHVMDMSVSAATAPGYGPPDGWMLLRNWLRIADAVVTYWPRHAAFYQSMAHKGRVIHTVPMGVDRNFWAGGQTKGKYAGTPSVWTSENPHNIKWPLDLLIAWPWVLEQIPAAKLHAHYIVQGLHRFFIDLANSNGAAYGSYLSGATYKHEVLRDMWQGFDFFVGLVRYGDFNCLGMQANAAGVKSISYRGNPYSDYWVTEGDQRELAKELVEIFVGNTPARVKEPVPDLLETARAMVTIYESIL